MCQLRSTAGSRQFRHHKHSALEVMTALQHFYMRGSSLNGGMKKGFERMEQSVHVRDPCCGALIVSVGEVSRFREGLGCSSMIRQSRNRSSRHRHLARSCIQNFCPNLTTYPRL